jgi:hypothetical protein
MDTNTKIYQIDKHKQLIPLNGSTVNFSCFFEVKSKDNKPFQIAIVEQGEIKPKQWKLAENGSINGQFESDGQLKSYFIVLKAQNPCECSVQIIVKPKETQDNNQLPQPTSKLPPHYSTLVDDSTNSGPRPELSPRRPKVVGGTDHQHSESNKSGNLPPSFGRPGVDLVQNNPESYFQLKYVLGISVAIIVVYFLFRYRKTIFGKFVKESFAPSISNSSF